MPSMVSSLFNPTVFSHTQMRPASQIRLRGQNAPLPFPVHGNKSPFITRTTVVPSSTSKSAAARRPSLTRTLSSPSTTTAPMYPDEILENLYISDLETARAVLSPNYAGPGRPKIKYVLTILDNPKEQPQVFLPSSTEHGGHPDFVLKLIKLSDYNEVNLLGKLPEACTFIRQSLANNDGGVLVHCRKGISRSGSVIVAYLMQEMRMCFEDALQQAKKARNKIWPNRGFGEQLRMWKDLDYALVDEAGAEKPLYSDWVARTKFRPDVYDG